MRVTKEAKERKDEILDAAEKLFFEKGYDDTSTTDILIAVGIARGTLYHHFKSKEDIMDELIKRSTGKAISLAKKIAEDKKVSVKERLLLSLMTLDLRNNRDQNQQLLQHLHQPQNALLHHKMNQVLIREVPPILAAIVEDGVDQGQFTTAYPLECMEMAIIYWNALMENGLDFLSEEILNQRFNVFIHHLELLLGAKPGELDFIKTVNERSEN